MITKHRAPGIPLVEITVLISVGVHCWAGINSDPGHQGTRTMESSGSDWDDYDWDEEGRNFFLDEAHVPESCHSYRVDPDPDTTFEPGERVMCCLRGLPGQTGPEWWAEGRVTLSRTMS